MGNTHRTGEESMEHVSALILAEWLGIDEMAVSRLGKSGVFAKINDPANKRGYLYELQGNVARYIAHLRGPILQAQEAYAIERAKTEKQKALKVEIEVRVRMGTLVPAEDVIEEMSAKLSVFKRRLLAVPARVAGSFAESESDRKALKALLDKEITDSLSMLSSACHSKNGKTDPATKDLRSAGRSH
jgi:hypothetical protein